MTTDTLEVPGEASFRVIAPLVVVRRRSDVIHLYMNATVPEGVAVEQIRMLLAARMIEEIRQ